MKRLRISISLLVVVVMSLTLFGGCGTSPSTTDGSTGVTATADSTQAATQPEQAAKPKIGVLVWDFSNQYVTYIRNAMTYYVGDKAELLLTDSQGDQTKQNDQIDSLLQKGVDALMVSMVQTTAAPTIIDKVKAYNEKNSKHIPLIFWNQAPTKEDMDSYDNAYYSGCSPYDGGVKQAEMAIAAVKANPKLDKNGDGKIQYVILKGMSGHPDAEQCTQGNEDRFAKETSIAFEKLDIQNADWSTAPAKDKTDAWIGKYGDKMELIMSNNDGMMLGAVEAFKGAGWFADDPKKNLLVIGHDAIPEMQTYITSGLAYGCILQNPVDEGRGAITMALNLLNGKPVETDLGLKLGEMKDYRAPFIPITKDNLQEAVDIYKIALGK